MSRKKKKARETLMKTHVLNLNEIRDAEVQDKYIRRRKMPKWFSIVGLLLILAGVAVSFIIASIAKEELEKEKNKKVKDKSIIVCVSNLMNNDYKCSIHTETTYKFDDGRLVSSSTVSTSKCTDNQLVEKFINDVHTNAYDKDKINETKSGLVYEFSHAVKEQFTLKFDLTYSSFKEDKRQKYINSYVKVPSLTTKNTYEQVKKNSEKLGALCN